jgi:hypothetical protein
MGYLSYMYVLPGVFGLVRQAVLLASGNTWCDSEVTADTYWSVALALVVSIWAIYFKNG